MVRRIELRALAVTGGLILMLAWAGSASANTVEYSGEATDLKPGQTKGLPVLVGFELKGKKCPKGPKCFKKAKMKGFGAVSYAFPNCPDLLDSAFVHGDPNHVGPIEEAEATIRVKKTRKFKVEGGTSASDFYDVISYQGRFKKKGKSASGTFTVDREGCFTDEIAWKATPAD